LDQRPSNLEVGIGSWIEHAARLGARQLRLHDDPADRFCVMADPSGNEFCVCRENDEIDSTTS
jgi:Glyoxalase-like domain